MQSYRQVENNEWKDEMIIVKDDSSIVNYDIEGQTCATVVPKCSVSLKFDGAFCSQLTGDSVSFKMSVPDSWSGIWIADQVIDEVDPAT